MVAQLFVCHSMMALLFCSSLGFLHKHSHLWSSSLPSPQAVSSQPTAVPSLGLLSKPHVPVLSPHAQWWTTVSASGVQCCGMDNLGRSHSVLPATDLLLGSPPSP